MNAKAWVAKAAKQPMVLETVDLGPLGGEEVEVAVEHCGLCHSDLSVLNNDWGISQYPGDSRPRGCRSCHGRRSEYKGTQGRTARRGRLVFE
jgi:threonine dehydrogenase-like Zn-dependent dehydrogenase